MSRGFYDDEIKDLVVIADAAGVSVPGTAASDTELIRVPITKDIKVETTGYLTLKTGGTAAGPSLLIGKSVDGTGAVSNIGTATPGTAADDTIQSITLTQTDFEEGDVLVLSNAAGTAAATLAVYGLTLKYKPDFD